MIIIYRNLTNSQKHNVMNIYREYKNSNNKNLYYVYEKPSSAKIMAEEEIQKEMVSKNGFDYRIISHNCNMFTCGYSYKDKEDHLHFVYHTKDDEYDYDME